MEKKQDDKYTISRVILVNRSQFKTPIQVMGFSSSSFQIITADYVFKIWNFVGPLKLLRKQEINDNCYISSLVISKKLNWLAFGCSNGGLQNWKEQHHWIGIKQIQKHLTRVLSLILNKEENELITCSFDSIKVWKVNCKTNFMEYYYTLNDNRITLFNYISINQSETYLASCLRKNKIVLWCKQNNQWKYSNEILNDDSGFKIFFLSDLLIAWKQKSKDVTHVYEIKNGQLIKRPDLNLSLNQENVNDFEVFPIVCNHQKQIVVQNHNKNIYILQRQENGQLKKIQNFANLATKENSSVTMMENGQFLVIQTLVKFRVYKIQYK